MVQFKVHDEISYTPSKEGHTVAQEGSPEARLWAVLPEGTSEGKSMAELKVRRCAVIILASGRKLTLLYCRLS